MLVSLTASASKTCGTASTTAGSSPHYASLLIRQGADIKTVQARVRHGSVVTTLRYYAHLWPDADETTRAAVGGVLKDRLGTTAYSLRTDAASDHAE
ncbi:hypothetical protein K8O92_05650 [Nocardia asteroides]|nr:hypothetical protein K8O92_05650 [Nocardia asteroides]